MCTYTQLKKNEKILKYSSMGVRDSTERHKIRLLRRKGYRQKITKI